MRKIAKKICMSLMGVAMMSIGIWIIVAIVTGGQLDVNCTQHIQNSANAATAKLAKQELEKAILWAEERGFTQGVVSGIVEQPKNDIGIWYENLSAISSELESLSNSEVSAETSMYLIKVQQKLINSSTGEVICPRGLEWHPYYLSSRVWIVGSIILVFVVGCLLLTNEFYGIFEEGEDE